MFSSVGADDRQNATIAKSGTAVNNPMMEDLPSKVTFSYDAEADLKVVDPIEEISQANNARVMSTFLVLNSMIGSGIFNQPYVFSKAGAGSAILLLTVTSLFVLLGMIALVETGIHTSTFDFSSLGFICLGRVGEAAVDFSIIVTGVGSVMSYIAVIGNLATTLLSSWGWKFAENGGIYVVTSVIIFVFVMPFCAYRSYGHFAFISVLSMGSVGCIILLLLIAGPMISPNSLSSAKYFIPSGALGQLGSIIFALNCAPSVFPVYNFITREHRTSKGWRHISYCSVLAGYLAILSMGLGGYLVFGDDTQEIIITNFVGHYADFFKLLVIVHLILYTPLDFVILRQSVLKVLGIHSGVLESWVLNLATTVFILGAILSLVLLLYVMGLTSGSAFSVVLGLTGGISGTLTSFVLPALFYMVKMPRNSPLSSACLLMFLGGLVVLFLVPVEVSQSLS